MGAGPVKTIAKQSIATELFYTCITESRLDQLEIDEEWDKCMRAITGWSVSKSPNEQTGDG